MRRILDNLAEGDRRPALRAGFTPRIRSAPHPGAGERRLRGFTLIELLVVIALTGLLLSLILGPLVQGFRLTNRARALAEAQDTTRFGLETLKRELLQAAYVFDNSTTPIILPLDLDLPNATRTGVYGNFYPVQGGLGQTTRPALLYAKVDFIPAATLGEGPGTAIDPTTEKPLGGGPVQLPAAPGRRQVRYFVGLRRNLPDAQGRPAFYQNVYEFPRTDNDMNTFVLYRAEYDPTDPNLIDQTPVQGGRGQQPQPRGQIFAFEPGGLHDPNFFYNTAPANSTRPQTAGRPGRTGNGRSYAENWRAVSSPVLATTNLDVIAWRRDEARQLVPGAPFQLQVNFAPSAVLSDTATPGYLTAGASEAPNAVPSLYTAKFGQWVYPFTVTVYRGATEFGGTRGFNYEPFGSLRFVVQQGPDPNAPGLLRRQISIANGDAAGVFGDGRSGTPPYFWLYDPNNGKIHLFAANVALTLDPSRGRVETAFPPLATQDGIPLYRAAPGATPQQLAPGVNGNVGTLVETVFRQNTRDDDDTPDPDADPEGAAPGTYVGRRAGQQFGPNGQTVPANQGIIVAHLAEPRYYEATPPVPPLVSLPVPGFPSPFAALGRNNNRVSGGLIMVPGSEKVIGPDNNLSVDDNNNLLLATYYRVPATGSVAKTPDLKGDPNAPQLYTWSGLLNYQLETDRDYVHNPLLKFDEKPNQQQYYNNAPGMPARALGNTAAPGELRVTYLWQNNYARNANGEPINAQGEPTTSDLFNLPNQQQGQTQRNAARPEADVVKLDYSTRALMNVTVGARVYDTSSGQPQTAQVSDRITINNVGR